MVISGSRTFEENFQQLIIDFEYCIESNEVESCAPEEQVKQLISSGLVLLFVQNEFKQLDMKNEEKPLKDMLDIQILNLINHKRTQTLLELSPNSFEDNPDWIGISGESRVEETEFLTVDNYV